MIRVVAPPGAEQAAADDDLVCERAECARGEGVEVVAHPDGAPRVLCRECRKHFLGVSS